MPSTQTNASAVIHDIPAVVDGDAGAADDAGAGSAIELVTGADSIEGTREADARGAGVAARLRDVIVRGAVGKVGPGTVAEAGPGTVGEVGPGTVAEAERDKGAGVSTLSGDP